MSMLQELLNLGLVDIGADDSRFTKIEMASQKLSNYFETSPFSMVTATLLALDENAPEDEPFFQLIEDLIIEEWKTFRNSNVNRPRELQRSIAISALFATVTDDPEKSAIVWNIAASRIDHAQTMVGRSAKPLKQSFQTAFATAEQFALRRAGMLTVAPEKPKRKTPSAPTPPTGAIKKDDLLMEVARAAGPQFPLGQPISNDPNPAWSNTQNWAIDFTPRITDAVVNAINLGTSRLATSMVDHTTAQMKPLESRLAEFEEASRMRIDVLWWSMARYSPSQNNAYLKLPTATAALAAAFDLATMVPSIAPTSVAHVLGETMAVCFGAHKSNLLDYLKQLKESPPTGLNNLLPAGSTKALRVPLLELVAEATGGSNISNSDLRTRVGVDPELLLETSELAMWLFRELQALRIAGELK